MLLYTLILFSKSEQDQGEQWMLFCFSFSHELWLLRATLIYQTKATCQCHNIKFVIYIGFKGRQFFFFFFQTVFALSCSLRDALIYLIFVMLLCITKFLHFVIIKFIFCFYPYANVNQPNPGMASTNHICFIIPSKENIRHFQKLK